MRGVLLVALGGVLIYLGIVTSAPGDDYDVNTTDSDRTYLEDPAAGDLAAGDPEGPEFEEATDPGNVTSRGDQFPGVHPDSEPGYVNGDDQAQVNVTPDPVIEATLDPDPVPDRVVLDHERDNVDDEADRRFELTPPGIQASVVASTLLEAWVARSPGALEALLNGDTAGDVPQGQRRLVGAFWQAMLGQGASVADQARELEGDSGVTSTQLSLLRTAIEGPGARPMPATVSRRDPLARSMRMVLLEEQAHASLERGRSIDAAEALSDLLHLELTAPWDPHRETLLQWADSLRQAQGAYRLSKTGAWPSLSTEVRSGDSLALVRQRVLRDRPELLLCTGLINRVNEIGKYIHPGDPLRIPTDRPNVLVDLDARLVVYRHGDEAVLAWPCGIGRVEKPSPTGAFVIGEKLEEPPWFAGDGKVIPYGDERNLLGERWMAWNLDGKNSSYGFHGTHDPSGVGQRVSSGCIRMTNESVIELFELLPRGADVLVQP
jgi:hypothetical protein